MENKVEAANARGEKVLPLTCYSLDFSYVQMLETANSTPKNRKKSPVFDSWGKAVATISGNSSQTM